MSGRLVAASLEVLADVIVGGLAGGRLAARSLCRCRRDDGPGHEGAGGDDRKHTRAPPSVRWLAVGVIDKFDLDVLVTELARLDGARLSLDPPPKAVS